MNFRGDLKIKSIYKGGINKISKIAEELFTLNYPAKPQHPPIFILGLPRSGTTLLYQYIVHRLKVSYFVNGTDQYPHAAVLNTWLRHRLYNEYISDFNNDYGKVPGPNAPHEAGSFWGRFFGFQDYVTYPEIDLNDKNAIQKSVASIEQIFGNLPFVNKNVKHLLRIDVLANIFPEACFIVIHRDLKDVGLSLVRGRYKNLGRADQWWSVRPPNWEKLDDMEPGKQIACQLISLNKKLQNDLEKISSSRVLYTNYKDFCRSPEELISVISNELNIVKRDTKIANLFEESLNTPQTQEEELLIHYVQ